MTTITATNINPTLSSSGQGTCPRLATTTKVTSIRQSVFSWARRVADLKPRFSEAIGVSSPRHPAAGAAEDGDDNAGEGYRQRDRQKVHIREGSGVTNKYAGESKNFVDSLVKTT